MILTKSLCLFEKKKTIYIYIYVYVYTEAIMLRYNLIDLFRGKNNIIIYVNSNHNL